MKERITHQIYETALNLLKNNPGGLRWVDLNNMIQKEHPDFHPKTINGCIWKLLEKYPDKVYKPKKGLFMHKKYLVQ